MDLSKRERALIGLYLIWCFVHTAILTFTSEESSFIELFWPLNSGTHGFSETYDVTEFVLYTGSPLVLYICYRLFFAPDQKVQPVRRKQIELGFLQALINEKIKAEELQQKINELTRQPTHSDRLQELKMDKEKLERRGVNKFLDRIEVKEKYKAFE